MGLCCPSLGAKSTLFQRLRVLDAFLSLEKKRALSKKRTSCREVKDYMNEHVNYVITAQEWDDTFDEVSSPLQASGN